MKSVPVDVLSKFHSSEENYPCKRIAEEEEEHANDDEEALVHADYHSQQQHLQSHLHSSEIVCYYYTFSVLANTDKNESIKLYSHASHIL